MRTKFVEVTDRYDTTHGKFMIQTFDGVDWNYKSAIDDTPLLLYRGWRPQHFLLFDLQTGEGAMFTLGSDAHAELQKRRIRVCHFFEPFLQWLLQRPDIMDVPAHLQLSEPGTEAYRRPGPGQFYRTPDGLVLCSNHATSAFETMTPPYVLRGQAPVERIELECGMCGQTPSPGRSCEKCGTPFDPQWPKVYCSNQCAIDDAIVYPDPK